MKASLSACRLFAAYISVTAIMPYALASGKPRPADGSHAIDLQAKLFPQSGMAIGAFSGSVASSFETRLAPLLRMRS